MGIVYCALLGFSFDADFDCCLRVGFVGLVQFVIWIALLLCL